MPQLLRWDSPFPRTGCILDQMSVMRRTANNASTEQTSACYSAWAPPVLVPLPRHREYHGVGCIGLMGTNYQSTRIGFETKPSVCAISSTRRHPWQGTYKSSHCTDQLDLNVPGPSNGRSNALVSSPACSATEARHAVAVDHNIRIRLHRVKDWRTMIPACGGRLPDKESHRGRDRECGHLSPNVLELILPAQMLAREPVIRY